MDLITNFKKYSLNDKVGIIFFILAIFSLLIILFSINESIWEDEAFSLLAIQYPFFEMINILSFDVHPLLYYVLLKFFIEFTSLFNLNVIIMAKFFSIIPSIFLLILAGIRIRKIHDWLFAGLFSFFIICMPQMMNFAIEIRMYSWAMLFVTLCFWYAYEITLDSSNKNWFLFIIFGILSTYMHYYAALSVIIIYFILAWHLFKNKSLEFNKYILAILISILCCLWNLKLMIPQILAVKHDFWIPKLTINSFIQDIMYICSPHNYHIVQSDLFSVITFINLDFLGVLLLILYFVLLVLYLKIMDKHHFLLNAVLVLVISVIIGILVSIFIKPVFIARYMIPSLACFWLTFAFLLSKFYNKKTIFIFSMILIVIVSGVNTYSFILTENGEYSNCIKFNHIVSEISSNENIILKNYSLNCNIINYYFPKNGKYLSSSEIDAYLINKKIWIVGDNAYIHLKNNYSLEKKYVFSQDLEYIPVYQIINSSST